MGHHTYSAAYLQTALFCAALFEDEFEIPVTRIRLHWFLNDLFRFNMNFYVDKKAFP